MKTRVNRNNLYMAVTAAAASLLLVLTVAGLIYFTYRVDSYYAAGIEQYTEYSNLYAFIADDEDSTLSETLYNELALYGASHDCYVQDIGANLSANYSKKELLEIAINSGVSGIILVGDDSEETDSLIDEASSHGIPVVTVFSDNPSSSRASYVGISTYNIGVEYGNLINSAADGITPDDGNISVLVLMDSEYSSENVMFTAITETLDNSSEELGNVSLTSQIIESDSAFNVEENVRDLFRGLDDFPDIIVCLSDINTRAVYQSIVDRNQVGDTTLIGYFDSDTVINAIDRGSIYATITVDTEQMAGRCVDALNEYVESGMVSEYFSADYILINKDNVSDYLPTE